jgi:hypothetical protein
VVVVVVLVLDNNNKNAEADPSTLFHRLSFDSFEIVTTGTDCYIIAGLVGWQQVPLLHLPQGHAQQWYPT